jgi:hypothetical protein
VKAQLERLRRAVGRSNSQSSSRCETRKRSVDSVAMNACQSSVIAHLSRPWLLTCLVLPSRSSATGGRFHDAPRFEPGSNCSTNLFRFAQAIAFSDFLQSCFQISGQGERERLCLWRH